MNLLNIKWPYAIVAFVVIILGGCATTQPIPELSHPQSAGFGIDVTIKSPIGIFSTFIAEPDQVYFVKIDEEGGLFQQQIIRSNYIKGGRAYLLNARPGTYVAVAAFFLRKEVPAGPPSPGFRVTRSRSYTTYFSKELVEHAKVTVGENDFAFMGSYVVKQSMFEGADGVQTHYKNVIAPAAATGILLMGLRGDFHYRGTMLEHKNDEQARNDFLRNAKEDLAGSAWAARIK